ncbi:MAG: heliorhodopsin HeR [Candidatus Cryosericum sp.]
MTESEHVSARTPYNLNRLRTYNALMGLLHLAQAVLIVILGWGKGLTVPITTNYLKAGGPGGMPVSTPQTLGTFRLGPAIAVFLLLSAIAHFVTILPGVFEWYKANLGRGINYIRWYEYALSSSVMIVIIAELSGMYDLPSTIMIFFLNAAMNLFGLMMELHNQTTAHTNWTAFIFGSIIGFIPWVVISLYFFNAAASATGTIPTFVYYILGTIFVFFNCFAINMVLQYRKVGKWRDYIFGERIYVLLSLVAKSALAWQIFFGAVARK